MDKLISEMSLAVSYDGVLLDPWRGVVLQEIRISTEKDFSRGRLLLHAQTLVVNFSWMDYFKSGNLKPDDMYLEYPVWNLYIGKPDDTKYLYTQMEKFLKSDLRLKIRFSKGKVYIHYSPANYRKIFLGLHMNSGNIIFSENSNLKVSYDDEVLGQGKLQLNQGKCVKADCSWKQGSMIWDFTRLPLEPFSDIIPGDYEFTGLAGGRMEINSLAENKLSGYNIKSDISATNVNIKTPAENILTEMSLSISGFWKILGDIYNCEAAGLWSNQKLKLKMSGDLKSVWPDNLNLAINGDQEKPLQIPGNYRITGIRSLSLVMNKPEQNYGVPYRNITASLEIPEGKYDSPDSTSILLHQIVFNMNPTSYFLKGYINSGSSTIGLDLKGNLLFYAIPFTHISYPWGDSRSIGVTEDIIIAAGNNRAELTAPEIHWDDLRPWVDNLVAKWKLHLLMGLSETMAVRQSQAETYYLRAAWKNNFNIKLNFDRIIFPEGEPGHINAEISSQNGYPSISIKGDHENSIEARAVYQNDMLFWNGNLQLDTESYRDLLRPFIHRDLLENWKNMKIKIKFQSAGQRPVNLYNYLLSDSDIQITNAVLGSYFREKNLPVQWSDLSVNLKSNGPMIWYYGIIGHAKNSILTGYGSSEEKFLKTEHNIHTDIQYTQAP